MKHLEQNGLEISVKKIIKNVRKFALETIFLAKNMFAVESSTLSMTLYKRCLTGFGYNNNENTKNNTNFKSDFSKAFKARKTYWFLNYAF